MKILFVLLIALAGCATPEIVVVPIEDDCPPTPDCRYTSGGRSQNYDTERQPIWGPRR